MLCENCGVEHRGVYGSGRFCSCKCARGFATKSNRAEINHKVSETFKRKGIKPPNNKGKLEDKRCVVCGKVFHPRKRSSRYCSRECIYRDPEIRINLSRKAKEKVKNGTHIGWQSRKKQSYPEKFFTRVLKNNNIFTHCIPEYLVRKADLGLNCASNFFLDFYFPDKNIDLEIDGKQHKYKDRKAKDETRDKALIKAGYKVYRIAWKNINIVENKKYMANEIRKFLEYYEAT